MNQKSKLLGLVLCGGRSTRMGKDKGLLQKGGESWAGLNYRKLQSLNIPVMLSVNSDQLSEYEKSFSSQNLISDQYTIPGPLNGLLSAHELFPGYDLFVLGCDLVDMREEMLKLLYSYYLEDQSCSENYAYFNEGYFEAVCSIYSNKALERVRKEVLSGKLDNYSLQRLLQDSNTLPVSIPDPFLFCFKNYNSPEELSKVN